MEDEYVAKSRRKKNKLRPYYPVIGFFLGLILLGVAFVLADPVNDMLRDSLLKDRYPYDIQTEMRYIVTGGLFIIFVLVAAMIYAVFAPKPTKLVTEKQLEKEKEIKRKEALAAKRRKRQIQRQMADERRREREQRQ